MDMMNMMPTYFFTDPEVKNFLFKDFNIMGVKGFVALFVVLFSIVIFFDGFKLLKIFFNLKLKQNPLTYNQTDTRTDDQVELVSPALGSIRRDKFVYHFLGSLFHMVNMVIGYLIMLSFMTYSVWMGLAITLGSGVGYWSFFLIQKKMVDKYRNLNTIHKQTNFDHERDEDWYCKVNRAYSKEQCHI